MNRDKSIIGYVAGATLALILCAVAVAASKYQGGPSRGSLLLFDYLGLLPVLAAFTGLFFSSVVDRPGDRIEGNKVLKHDGVARITHWTTAFGCVLLIVTGVLLGFLFVPRMVTGAEATAMLFNLHFVGALFFMFGCSFWVGNQIADLKRARQHLPDEPIGVEVKKAITHYLHTFGLSKKHVEGPKYHHSGRLAGLVIIASSVGIVVTGLGKLSARAFDLSPWLAKAFNLGHDYLTLIFIVLIPMHAFLGALAPWAWKNGKAMITGYLPVDYARKEHSLWFKELQEKEHK